LPLYDLFVSGKRHEVNLRPLKGRECKGRDDSPTLADGSGTRFELEPIAGTLPRSWVLFTADATPGASAYSARLVMDTGAGFSEADSIRLHVTRQGIVNELIRLPSGVRRILWQSAGPFRPQSVSIKETGAVERIWRMVRRIVPAYFSHSWKKRGRCGLTLTRLLLDLPGAYEAAGRLRALPATRAYKRWLNRHDTLSGRDLDRVVGHIRRMESRPLFSILMPVFNTPERLLREAIESVFGQIYPHWELCIADDNSDAAHVRPLLEEYARRDARVKVNYQSATGHISRASNAALSLATGEFIALLDHDDVLAPLALYWVAAELQRHPTAQIVYSDEDKIDEDGERFTPYCKPDWNPQLALSQNFVNHFGVYRAETVRSIGGFRVGYEGSQDYDLMLRVSELARPDQILHVPAILYHWRATAGSTALSVGEKNYAWEAGRRAIEDHLRRRGVEAEVSRCDRHTYYRVRFSLPKSPPKVSIIIPTRDSLELLSRCVESVVSRTSYSNYEVLVIDNGSVESGAREYLDSLRGRHGFRVLSYAQPFNYSAMNNLAVGLAEGELVCLLNNDTEVITPEWLQEMAGCLLQPGVGVVGARLLFQDRRVQHAGVLVGVGGIANHVHAFMPRDHPGYFARAWLAQDWSAVTGACMMIRRSLYDEIGGMDAAHLAVAFNDVDFCLRARAAGWRVVYTPHAELYHHESATRGADKSRKRKAQARRERDYMRRRWGRELNEDPFYNPNLSSKRPFFTLSPKPRIRKPWLTEWSNSAGSS
jgi:GT2 family glycosyltransferase